MKPVGWDPYYQLLIVGRIVAPVPGIDTPRGKALLLSPIRGDFIR